ncbi:MAG: metal-dependent hydrolase [Thermoplasmata archaeon]
MVLFRNVVDPFSHYIVAYAAGRKANVSLNKMRALTLAAVIPDIDGFSIFMGIQAFHDIHGGPVHSFLIGVVLALVITLGFYIYSKENVALCAFTGVFLHFALDVPNTLGYTRATDGLFFFWPFSDFAIDLQNHVPGAAIWHIVVVSTIFILCTLFFLLLVRKGEYAWRIWLDERKFQKKKAQKK